MSRTRPFLVGLTGGIGSGKTTVCRLFAELGVEIIDADLISRQVVSPGSPALQQLTAMLGSALVSADGTLHRQYLRELVFSDGVARRKVEAILHPLIRAAILQQISRSGSRWLIVSAPLLLESKAYEFVDRILVVDASEEQQLQRTLTRDHCSEEEVRRIMQIQLSRADRLGQATDIIQNDSDMVRLQEQVATLYALYEKLAREREHPQPV